MLPMALTMVETSKSCHLAPKQGGILQQAVNYALQAPH